MNIHDLPAGSYQVTQQGGGTQLNVKNLAPGSYTVGAPKPSIDHNSLAYLPTQLAMAGQQLTDFADAIPGVKTLGNVFGTAAATALAPQDQKAGIMATMPSVESTIGAGMQAAAIPAGIAAAPATVLGSAATFGALGAASAGGSAMEQNASAGTTAKKAFVGGLVGAGIGAAGALVQKGIQTAAANDPKAIMNNVLKISNKIKGAGKSPSQFLVDQGVWGSLGSMAKQIKTGMTTENTAIQGAVSELDSAGDVPTPSYDQMKQDAVSFLSGTKLGKLFSDGELAGLVDKVPLAAMRDAESMTWTDLNSTRSSLGQYLSDAKWLQTTPTESTQATKAMYGALSDAIKGATGTDENFANYSQWIEANKAVGKALQVADGKWGWGLLDSLSTGLGAVVGAFAGNPIAGAAFGEGANRILRSPITQSGAAQALASVPAAGSLGGSPARAASTAVLGGMIGSQ